MILRFARSVRERKRERERERERKIYVAVHVPFREVGFWRGRGS